jgi:hypothetical protein
VLVVPPNSAWIGFLRNYGPLSTNGNMYDERIERSRRRAGVAPAISLPDPATDLAVACLQSAETPTSVILTGTAGDGKTYHCRRIWERLGGDPEQWAHGDRASPGIRELDVGSRKLLVVKDLSELNEDTGLAFFSRIFSTLSGDDRSLLFLIAANVGQLHDEWQAAIVRCVGQFPRAVECWAEIESQLFGREATPQAGVRVFDLSRGDVAMTLGNVLNQILDHPAWDGCSTCELRATTSGPCPIWGNRERMREGELGARLHSRLKQLVHLQAQNGRHLTVRHLLMLVVNALLGHPEVKQDLLACEDVAGLQRQGTISAASLYNNLFGENLPERQRAGRELFDKLNRVGIGTETSNRIDRILTYGVDDPDLRASYDELVGRDTVYGHTPAWAALRDDYIERGESDEFLKALRRQRQRLFFTMPEDKTKALGLWELTIYHYADEFLRTAQLIRSAKRAPQEVVRRLIQGINRVFTGQLLREDDRIILASSGSSSQSKTSLLYEGSIPRHGDAGERIDIVPGQRTDIALRVDLAITGAPPIDLDLTVLRFEFLSRVAEGALPSSFSLECHEDILAFKARVLRAVERRRRSVASDSSVRLQLLEISIEGRVQPRTVEVYGDD